MSQNDPGGLAHAKKLIKECLETQATFLDLGNCGLRDLSELPELWECQHLEGLNMGRQYWVNGKNIESKNSFYFNQIGVEGAKFIAEYLQGLTSLDLTFNKIGKDGAKVIAENLKSLTSLNLSSIRIGDEGAKFIAENLTYLASLNLKSNQIGDVGAKYIAKNLLGLTSLELSFNNIALESTNVITENLKSLTSLNLCNNLIINLESLLFLFKKENCEINFSNNPISNPPIEVLNQGREAIIRYYENLEKAKKVNLSPIINKEVKLIIAGNSNAGKSTLVKYLTEGVIDKNLPTTHWMEIKNWINPFPNKPHIENIRIFDFGGQEYYHDTHYLFFTQNTAYILLWDEKGNVLKNVQISQKSAVDGQKKDVNLQCFPLEYWLDAISHYASTNYMEDTKPSYFINEIDISKEINVEILKDLKNAVPGKSLTDAAMPPVLIVQNKLDYNAPSKLPLNLYQDKYYDILIYDGIAISLIKKRFLDNLRYYIASMLEDMNIVGKQFPGIYGIIKERIISPNVEMSLTIDQFMVKSNEWILEEGKKSGKDFASLTMDHENTKDCAQAMYMTKI